MNLATKQIKGYELKEQLGLGGFGAVYRAYQNTVGREVAIKIILPNLSNQPDFVRRFEGEAQVVARLEHPHITPLYDYWRDADGAYLVMRWLRGGSLGDALQKNGAFELPVASQLIDQIAAALSLAHRNNIIHRDIKPGNILLDEDGNAYLTDFGIAKDLNLTSSGTQQDAIVGSLDYISPEQARSQPVTPRTDIYSLGVTLYEIITGHHPFDNVSSIERLYKHINDPLPEIENLDPQLSDDVNRVIQKATQKNPDNRYADALGFAADFRQAIGINRTSTTIEELLTKREHEILNLIIEGLSNKEIALRLTITLSTVKWYVNQIYDKLGVRSRVQAIIRARDLDLIGKNPQPTITADTENFFPENPYKGLCAFQSGDHQDFFGRENVTAKLLKRMNDTGDYQRFLAVVGPSGSGKSSLVKAGLIPALWRGEVANSEKWFVVEMMPSTRPIDELEVALTKIATTQSANLHEHLSRDVNGLSRAANLILPNDGSELVIIIDQFEEVFTLVENETARKHFLGLLHAAVTEHRSRVRVVVTLRADFYDRPLHYPQFGEMLRNRLETIMPLSAQELENAIRKPAERVGVSFETGLVATIVADVSYQPGALPLLQYALTELFEHRQGRILTREAYEAIGKTTGALAKRAEEIYQSLNEVDRELTRQMFLRLVTLGEGTEDTRRRTTHAELLGISKDNDAIEDLLDTFTNYRLLSSDTDTNTRQPTIEVAHEALIREWERLKIWLNESRTEIQLQRQLSQLATEWLNANRDKSFLARGSRLETFERWSKTNTLTLNAQEVDFLNASLQQRQSEADAETEQKIHEQALEERAQKILRTLLGVFVCATLIAGGLAIFAFDRQAQAERESDVNYSLVLANQARELYALGETDLALRTALEAVDIVEPPAYSIQSLSEIARAVGTRGLLEGHTNAVTEITISADNHTVASGSCAQLVDDVCGQGEIILWDLQTMSLLQRINTAHHDWITGLSFNHDGTQLIASAADGTLILWNVSDGSLIKQFDGGDVAINAVVYHPQSDQILTAGQDGVIRLWDVDSGAIIREFQGHEGAVNNIAFNLDGTQMLSGGQDTLVLLWDVENGAILKTYEQTPAGASAITYVAFDYFNHWVIGSGTRRNSWDQETGEISNVSGASVRTSGLAIGSDGTAYEGEGRFVRLENPRVDQSEVTGKLLYDHDSIVRALAVTSDNHQLLTGANDGIIRIWHLNGQMVQQIPLVAGASSRITLSPDNTKLAIGAFGARRAYIYDLVNGTLLHQINAEFPISWELEFSPDGRYLAIGFINFYNNDTDTSFALWDVESGELVRTFEGHTLRVSSMNFTSDGRYILSASQSFSQRGELFMWDVETGALVREFDNVDPIASLSVSRDSQFVMTTSYFNKYIAIWDMATGSMLRRRDFDTHIEFGRLGFTDQTALVGLDDGRLLEVDIATLDTIRSFDGHTGTVWDIDISDNGQWMVSGQSGGVAIIWDYETGREIDRIKHRGGYQTNVAFGRDDLTIFTSAYQREVIEWYLNVSSLDTLLEWTQANRYIRDFTCTERQRYSIKPLCAETTGS